MKKTIIIILILLVFQLVLICREAAFGNDFHNISLEYDALSKENQAMEVELATKLAFYENTDKINISELNILSESEIASKQ